MNTPHLPFPVRNELTPASEVKPGFRTKTVATRLTPRELSEVEAAAEGAGKSLAEWLRETALRTARQRPVDPLELLMAELWALRYTLLNLFHSEAFGDRRQHEAVEAGRPFAQLQDAGMKTVKLEEIVRQKDPELKQVVEQLARGEVREAIQNLDGQGRVHEIQSHDERIRSHRPRLC